MIARRIFGNRVFGAPGSTDAPYDRLVIRCLTVFVAIYPLVVNPFAAPVFTLPKLTFLRVFAATLLAIWGLKFVHTRRIEFVRTPINPLLLGLFSITVLSTLASVSRTVSFVGQYGRWEGLLTTFCYLVLALAAANFVDRDGLKVIIKWFLVSAALVAAITIVESFWFNPITSLAAIYCAAGFGVSDSNPFGSQRPIAVFGNPDYLAAYLVMALAVALAVIVWGSRSNGRMLVAPAAGVLAFVALALTQSRAGWVAAGITITIVLARALANRRDSQRALVVLAVVIIVSVGLGIWQPHLVSRAQTFANPRRATEQRLEVWRSTARIIADRPLLGSGPGTFPLVYPLHSLATLPDSFERAPVDRAHNLILQQTATTGLAGGLALLILIALLVFETVKSPRRAGEAGSSEDAVLAVRAAALAALAYAIQALVNPTHLSGTVFFWLFVGLVFGRAGLAARPSFALALRIRWADAYRLALVVIWLILVTATAYPLLADIKFNQSLAADSIGRWRQALSLGRDSVRLFPYESQYHVNLGELYVGAWQVDPRPSYLVAAKESFRRSFAVNRADSTAYFRAGSALLIVGRQTNDWALLQQVIAWEEKGLKDRPNVIDAHLDIGVAEIHLGRIDRAVKRWKRAAALAPDDARPHINLGWAYEQQGRPRAALAAYRRSVRLDDSLAEAKEAVARLDGGDRESGVFTKRALP